MCLPSGSSSKEEVEYRLESDCRAAWQGEGRRILLSSTAGSFLVTVILPTCTSRDFSVVQVLP